MKRRIAGALFLALSMGMTGCGDDGSSSNERDSVPDQENPELLAERASYTVGVRQTTVTYQPPEQEAARTLPVIVWYPSDETAGRKDDLKLAKVMKLPTSGYRNLALAEDGPFPVVVHSHGSGGEASLAYPAAEVFASRGWVVISISHSGNTTLDSLSDPLDVPMYIPVYRMLDVSQTLDDAEQGFGWEGFEGSIDTNNVFMYGHSFGGYTSMAIGGATFLRDGAKKSGL